MSIFKGDIRILGPRPSGKFTFIAALASFPNAGENNSPILSIEPLNNEAQRLVQMTQDLMRHGMCFSPMHVGSEPLCRIAITLKSKLNLIALVISYETKLDFFCKPYAGELFDSLNNNTEATYINEYLDDLATVRQIIFLIDSTSKLDYESAQAIRVLENKLNSRLTSTDKLNYRIAVVFSKFEQPEAWIYRFNLDKFTALKFPQVKSTILDWSNSWKCCSKYFACSAYGITGNPPVANTTDISRGKSGTFAVLKESSAWQPFGLLSPIHWLLTGKHDRRLDDYVKL